MQGNEAGNPFTRFAGAPPNGGAKGREMGKAEIRGKIRSPPAALCAAGGLV